MFLSSSPTSQARGQEFDQTAAEPGLSHGIPYCLDMKIEITHLGKHGPLLNTTLPKSGSRAVKEMIKQHPNHSEQATLAKLRNTLLFEHEGWNKPASVSAEVRAHSCYGAC